jgi:hypothetical protein
LFGWWVFLVIASDFGDNWQFLMIFGVFFLILSLNNAIFCIIFVCSETSVSSFDFYNMKRP